MDFAMQFPVPVRYANPFAGVKRNIFISQEKVLLEALSQNVHL